MSFGEEEGSRSLPVLLSSELAQLCPQCYSTTEDLSGSGTKNESYARIISRDGVLADIIDPSAGWGALLGWILDSWNLDESALEL